MFPGFGNQGGNQPQQGMNQFPGCNVEERMQGLNQWSAERRVTQDHTGQALQSANSGRNMIFGIAAILIIGGLLQGYFTKQENTQLRQGQPMERVR